MKIKPILTCISMLLMTSCASIPEVRDWRPWYRIDGNSNTIKAGSKILLDVVANNKILIGSDALEKDIVSRATNKILTRRGYEVVSNNQDYTLKIMYDISKVDQLNIESSYINSSFGSISNAYGVNTAYIISSRASRSETKVNSSTGYYNVLSVESIDKDKKVIWKGNAVWESSNIGIQTGLNFAIKVLLSDLPKQASNIFTVDEVKESHALNYFNVNCLYPLSSPGVPYKIFFNDEFSLGVVLATLPWSIKNKNIISACVDMISNAEYALPNGGMFSDLSNPLDKSLWSKLQLGEQYYIGKQKFNVLVDLKSTRTGYDVDSCRIATDEEFKNYKSRLSQWEKSLADFYDFYKK